jgi:Spy/CpxP family protein refolding chaperone
MQTVQDMRTSLNEMLSPEQREKLNEIMQAARSQVGLQLLRLERKLAKLILTDEQKLKMDELKSEVREQMQAIRQEVAADRQGAAQKVRELTQSLRRRLAEILTADQQKELRELMRPAGGEGKPEPQGETARK